MKKIHIIFQIIFLLSISEIINAQNTVLDYRWGETAQLTESIKDTSVHSEILKLHQIREFVVEDRTLVEYVLFHKKIKILNENVIDSYNKIYIPQFNILELVSIDARVINPDGSVIILEEENIKEGTFEDTDIKYKYFALEGIEKGSEIEYMYKTKKVPSYNGYSVTAQTDVIRKNYEFDVVAPSHLIFKFKSYNGLPEFERDTLADETLNVWRLQCDSIPAVEDEIFSNYDNDVKRFLFKLDKVLGGKSDLMSYGPLSDRLYKKIYEVDKKEIKVLEKVLKNIPEETDPAKYIRSIEDYIKEHYVYNESDNYELSSVNKIVSNKVYNQFGAVKFYANLLKLAGIKHEIVLTKSRYKLRFDKDFSCYLYLDDYLIYFPQINSYLTPQNSSSRLGLIPYIYNNNYGLFIKEVSVGDFATAVSKVKFIEPYDYKKTGHVINVNAVISDDLDNVDLNMEQVLTGYYAYFNQPVFDYIKDDEKIDEFLKKLVNVIDIDDEVTDYTAENKGAVNLGKKPFIVKGNIKTDKLIENAGNKYIFKAGKLIGKQFEMYDETERKLDLEFNYPHYLKRELTIKIPEGYAVKNLNSLKINEQFVLNEDTVFGFVSDYKLSEDNTLKVDVYEWYKGIRYDKKYFEDFKRVMNAAANFNKASLFIYKEE